MSFPLPLPSSYPPLEPREPMIWIMGMNMAITTVPTTTAKMMIIIGSITEPEAGQRRRP